MKQRELDAIGRKHVRRIKRWMSRLWLGHWFLYGHYVETIREEEDEDTSFKVIAEVEADYKYRKATVTIACAMIKKLNAYNQERNACHEVVHIATSGYQSIFDKLLEALPDKQQKTYRAWWSQVDEQTTEHLTNALMELTGKHKLHHEREVVELKDFQGEGEAPKASQPGSRLRPAPRAARSARSQPPSRRSR